MGNTHIEGLESRCHLADISGGLVGTYYDNGNFTGATVERVDQSIAFSWNKSSPDSRITGNFSARWTADLTPAATGRHAVYVSTEGGVRVWINHKLMLNRWTAPGVVTHYKIPVELSANVPVDLLVEYRHDAGKAAIGVTWVQPGQPKEILSGPDVSARPVGLEDQIDHALIFSVDQLGTTYRTLNPKNGVPTRSDATNPPWLIRPFTDWTGGTFAGAMWELDEAYPGAGWDKLATTWTTPLAGVKIVGDSFDREWTAYKGLFDKTGDATATKVLLDSAALKMSAWNKTVRAFKTPELVSTSGDPKANFGVLMDQSMDMEHLLWAGEQTGNVAYRDRVTAHMYTVARPMVRKNGSVVQRGYFDAATGAYILGENSQGYSNTSTWSRAQAWAIHSFATVGATLGNADLLAVARKTADFFIANAPADGVPFWDFNAPDIPKTYRDSSAAAITAGGLLRLAEASSGDNAARYRAAAEKILRSLLSPAYLAEGATVKGVLQHGAAHVPAKRGVDSSLMFGDYYVLDAMNRYRGIANSE